MFASRLAGLCRPVVGRGAVSAGRPAVRGFRSSAALGNRRSSGNGSDNEGYSPSDRHVIGALVVNEPGVLAGVATLLAGRGFNIDSLVVGRTEIPELSRMTIVVKGNEQALSNVRSTRSVHHLLCGSIFAPPQPHRQPRWVCVGPQATAGRDARGHGRGG